MAEVAKKKQPTNIEWDLSATWEKGSLTDIKVTIALLMDVRGELRKLNKTLTEASIFVNGKVG